MSSHSIDINAYDIEIDEELALIVCKKTLPAPELSRQQMSASVCASVIPKKKNLFYRHLRAHGFKLARTEAIRLWEEVSSKCAFIEGRMSPEIRIRLERYRKGGHSHGPLLPVRGVKLLKGRPCPACDVI